MKNTYLKEILDQKAKDIELEKKKKSINDLIGECRRLRKDIGKFKHAIRRGKKDCIRMIGEIKRASPSKGFIRKEINPVQIAKAYEKNKVEAVSILTEKRYFKGSLDDLSRVSKAVRIPILRKDFIIDPYQVYEAKVIGADAVLLIAAILDDSRFKELYDLAYSLGLDVLCEVHNEEEMQRMLNLDVKIIGINNRNLKTFEVDLDTTKKLADMVTPEMRKAGKLLVSESGVADTDDIKVLAKSGADALLIGTVLMEAPEPEELISEFKEVYNAERK